MKITLIRHGATKGNLEKRYIGATNESLCSDGVEKLLQNKNMQKYPKVDKIVISPMLRCVQTANIIYPSQEMITCNKLKECYFGDFENKNYLELSDNQDYQKWIDSKGTMVFPNGESMEAFKDRSIRGFQECVEKYIGLNIAFIVHGGTIMAVLEKYADPNYKYFHWQVANGEGFMGEWKKKELINLFKIE